MLILGRIAWQFWQELPVPEKQRNTFVHSTVGATTNQLRRLAVTRENWRPGRDEMFVGTEATTKGMIALVNEISAIRSDVAALTLRFSEASSIK